MSKSYKYDTFNARYLSFEEVANTFIPYQVFEQLISNNHTLLMGPRGCGKTTLLKMLTPKAVHSYNLVNQKAKITLPFIGIYIPSDKQWEKQMSNFDQRFQGNLKFAGIISREIVNANILISVFNTFIDLLEVDQEPNLTEQFTFCAIAIETLKIRKPVSPTLLSIVRELKNRIIEINVIVNKIDSGLLQIEQVQYPDYFFSDFFNLVTSCCADFNDCYSRLFQLNNYPQRWALCFDELEIAPEWLQKELITNHLRGRDQHFLFKLTTTPLVDTKYWLSPHGSSIAPSQNEDYKVIRNWVFNQESNESWKKFSDRLFTSLIKREFNLLISSENVFGRTQSNIDEALSGDSNSPTDYKKFTSYSEGSIEWYIFKQLAERDESFYKFLGSKGVLAWNPSATTNQQKDTIFRKIKLIVFFRYYFKRGTGLRSRKVVDLYSGIPLIYELADGNPRTLLNLFDSFKTKMIKNGKSIKKISISDQARVIKEVCSLKLENIKNHPDANVELDGGMRLNLGQLLEEIGQYFFSALVKDNFTMDPATTFIIDKNVHPKVVTLLKFGLNIGAIQYLDPKHDMSDEDVYNKKYRLNFTLGSVFNLPVREYNSLQLSRMLPKYSIHKKKNRFDNNDLSQPQLF